MATPVKIMASVLKEISGEVAQELRCAKRRSGVGPLQPLKSIAKTQSKQPNIRSNSSISAPK
jgi:hypothetical protein